MNFRRTLNSYFAILLITLIASSAAYWLEWQSNRTEYESSLLVTVRRQVARTAGNSRDISTWKTYRNEKYGFEIRYPKEWHVGVSEYDADVIQFENPETQPKNSDCNKVLTIHVFRGVPLDTGLQAIGFETKEHALKDLETTWGDNPEWVKQQSTWINSHDASYYTFGGVLDPGATAVKNIKINNYEAFKADGFARCYYDEGGIAGSGEVARILLLGDAMTYAVIYMYGDDQGVVSTFKFTR